MKLKAIVKAVHIWTLGVWREWKITANGEKYLGVLYELDMEIRNKMKHSYPELPKEVEEALWEVRQSIRSLCNDRGVSLEDWED